MQISPLCPKPQNSAPRMRACVCGSTSTCCFRYVRWQTRHGILRSAWLRNEWPGLGGRRGVVNNNNQYTDRQTHTHTHTHTNIYANANEQSKGAHSLPSPFSTPFSTPSLLPHSCTRRRLRGRPLRCRCTTCAEPCIAPGHCGCLLCACVCVCPPVNGTQDAAQTCTASPT
jgi:hypothetical protein